ncbi:MAG TPA: YfhO family protein [Planctomycetota bacterium]|nr:YfhO family protein [Planctomycetota bacterium]
MRPAQSVPSGAGGNRSEFWRALAWLLLLPVMLLGPSLLPGKRFLPLAPVAFEPLASENPAAAAEAWRGVDFLASDALFPMLSDAQAMRASLGRGELPLWDATTALGAPLYAQTMFGALYPPHWLAFVMPADLALGWIAWIDLVVAGLGLYLFTRGLGLSFGASLVGAAVFQTAGFASANLHDVMKVEAGLWLPWTLLAIERVLGGERRALLGLAATVALSFLAGFVPIALFCAAAALAYAVARGITKPSAASGLASCALGIALGIGLSAIQLIPTAEARDESSRGERHDPLHAADGLPLEAGLTLVAPEIFGRADEPVFAPVNASLWWLARSRERELASNANLLEWNLFAGALALALACAAVFARTRASLFPAILALVALGFAQGWPGIHLLRGLPGLDLGSPARAGVLAWTAWAWLAAIGADAVLLRERRSRVALLPSVAFVLLGLALAYGVDATDWIQHLPDQLAARFDVAPSFVDGLLPADELTRAAQRVNAAGRSLAIFASLGLLCLAGLALTRGSSRWTPAWLSLFIVAAAEGAWYSRVHLAPREISGSLWPESPSMEALRSAAGDGRVLRFDESESGVSDVLNLARPNLPAAYGIADLSPYVVFTPRRSVELWSAIDPGALWRNGVSRISRAELLDHPVLDVLRVTAILARRPLAHPRLETILEREGFCVYRRRDVPPRARVVTSAIATAGFAGPVQVLATRMSDPRRQTVLPPGAPEWNCEGEAPRGTLEIQDPSASRVTITTRDTPRGWLVLADAWYPGWRASIDGRDTPIEAVDHALRGVRLEAGNHEVRFEYAPSSLGRGALVSGLSLAILIALWWRGRAKTALS